MGVCVCERERGVGCVGVCIVKKLLHEYAYKTMNMLTKP